MRAIIALITSLLVATLAASAGACPFCPALKPTLAQRREGAVVVALGECVKKEGSQARFRLHELLKGESRLGGRRQLELTTTADLKAGSLAVLFGEAESKQSELSWSLVPMEEQSYAYFAKAPTLRVEVSKRLRYFAQYLEHADGAIAEDAYAEFGHASYDEVAAVAGVLDQAKLRRWLTDVNVPETRKGFFGMALGLAKDDSDRRANERLLEQLILEPAPDVRAGFDGMLGGYLLLAGEAGLAKIERRFLANPKAAVGDVRHAMTALRFYHDYGPQTAQGRLKASLRHLLARPEFAAAAIVDLARWQDWDALERIVSLYGQEKSDLAVKRAIVGYLLVCPNEQAALDLERLRRSDPKTVADAEKSLALGSKG
jgi:hypothetical protein